MDARNQHEAGKPVSRTAFRVIEGSGDQQELAPETPELGLERIHSRFSRIALANSPWFGGVSVKANFLGKGNVDLHPQMMRSVVTALEGRNPRYGVVRDELRVTFDLLGPEEASGVADLARNLGKLFGGSAGYGVLRDENAPYPEADEASEIVEMQVAPLARTDT